MIAMIVSDQDIIDLRDSRLMCRSHDPVSVTAFTSGPTCIDEKRFARWADYESRLSALTSMK